MDNINVSIYSHKESINDRERREKGLFNNAVSTIQSFRKQKTTKVSLQMILTKYNIDIFKEYVQFAYDLNVNEIYLSILEGNTHALYSPTSHQIQNFNNRTIDTISELINRLSSEEIAQESKDNLQKLFPKNLHQIAQYSKGFFFPDQKPPCAKPISFALILANGDVHPCNGVEYSKEPVVGNIFDNNLSDGWSGSKWQKFRNKRMDASTNQSDL